MRVTKLTAPSVLTMLVAVAAAFVSSSKASPRPTISSAKAAKAISPTFVGKVRGTNAYIGVVANVSSKIAVYVCDGAGNKIGDFFRGGIRAGAGKTTLKTTDSRDTLTINASPSQLRKLIATRGAITGTWNRARGARHRFTAQAARAPGALWGEDEKVNGAARHGKWVVLNDGSVRGSLDLDYKTQKSAAEEMATQGQSTGAAGSDVEMELVGMAPPSWLAYQTGAAVVKALATQTTEKSEIAVKVTKSADSQAVFKIERVSPDIPEG